jgi:hypothetical protein
MGTAGVASTENLNGQLEHWDCGVPPATAFAKRIGE